MQYTQRKLQRSVTEMRRSCSARSRRSASRDGAGPADRGIGRGPRCSWSAMTVRFAVTFMRKIRIARGYSEGMIEVPTRRLAVVLEREPIESPWQDHQWQLLGVLPDTGGEPRTLLEEGVRKQRLFPGLEVDLHPDEAEGYYLNVSTEAPSVFVSIRHDEGAEDPRPYRATLSYNEAARWMDGGERVERAPAWPELVAWTG